MHRDDVIPVDIKKTPEDEGLLLHAQFRRGYFRQNPIEVLRSVFDVILELTDKRGGNVDSGFHAFLGGNHFNHVEVILGSMHAHPWAGVYAVLILVIHRLMLMPGQVNVERILLHCLCFFGSRVRGFHASHIPRYVRWIGSDRRGRASCEDRQTQNRCQ